MRALAWEATLDNWAQIAPVLGLPGGTWPAVPGFVSPTNATAKCLLAQWKIVQRADLIRELLGAGPSGD